MEHRIMPSTHPHSFSQASATYAEDKDVFGTLMNALQEVVAVRPPNPVQALLRYFVRQSGRVARVAVIGPPFSGRHTLAFQLSHVFDAPLLDYDRLFESADPQLQVALKNHQKTKEPLPPELAFSLLRQRIFSDECIEKGWVLCGFPETRAQDELFRRQGICPQKTIILNATRENIFHRRRHTRFDPVEKRTYSAASYMPFDKEVRHRLVLPAKEPKTALTTQIRNFAYEALVIMKSASSLSKEDPCCVVLDGNRPVEMVFDDALRFVSIQPIQKRPYMHRLLFVGLPGTGKKTMASRLAGSFRLRHISSGTLVMQAATDPENENFREINALLYKNRPIPDDLVGEMLNIALRETGLQGFILRGFPRNRVQAEMLNSLGFRPSRVFFFECPTELATERLMSRGRELWEKAADLQDAYEEPSSWKKSHEQAERKMGFLDAEGQQEIIEAKNTAYMENADELKEFYKDCSYQIDASLVPDDVLGQIKFHLLHPLPLRPKREVLHARTPFSDAGASLAEKKATVPVEIIVE